MDIEVQDKDNNYQEQDDQSDKKYKNTPYAGESQQYHFGNVDDTPTANIDEASVLSTREQPHRACHKAPDYKYTAAHTSFMEQQEGANMMQTYFEIEASLSTPQYGFRRGSQLFGDKGYRAALKELDENLVGRGRIEVLPKADVM